MQDARVPINKKALLFLWCRWEKLVIHNFWKVCCETNSETKRIERLPQVKDTYKPHASCGFSCAIFCALANVFVGAYFVANFCGVIGKKKT